MADHTSTRAQPKRNTEARREQNRLASRNYRQKRKQKLALLDQLLTPEDDEINGSAAAGDALTVNDPSTIIPPTAFDHTEAPSLSDSPPLEGTLAASAGARPSDPTSSLIGSLTNHGWTDMLDFPPDSSFAPDSDVRLPFYPEPALRTETLAPTILSSKPSSAFSRSSMQIGGTMGQYLPPDPSEDQDADEEAVLEILSGVRNLSLKQKQGLLHQLQDEVGQPETDNYGIGFEQPGLSNWVSAYARPGQGKTRLQSEAKRFAAFVDKYASGSVGPAQLSRIYSAEAGLFGALFANCYALGMSDVEPLMVEEGVSIFSLGPDTGYHDSQLAVVRPRFDGVTPDLRPCDVQLTFGHHPYLDVLPFKVFREKSLRALGHDPPLIDEDELCKDLSAGGLICWGSQQNSHGMEAGVPWDARSWEPKIWFLRKYWHLVGGWDDEMWNLARWWHSQRNEKIRA